MACSSRKITVVPCHPGLDPSSYRSAASRQDEEGRGEEMLGSGEGQLSGAKPLFVQCLQCQRRVEVRGSKVREVLSGTLVRGAILYRAVSHWKGGTVRDCGTWCYLLVLCSVPLEMRGCTVGTVALHWV